MGSLERSYEVVIKSVETVTASSQMKDKRLALSNFDLLLPPLDVGVFLCFRKPTTILETFSASVGLSTFPSMVTALKEALSKVLVIYYPLAGQMSMNSSGEPEILCNNRGVDVIEAYADVELGELNLYNPDDSMEAKLVPNKKSGILCIQVTELRCGGVVVGCVFDHRVADAYSFNMFMSTWANIATDQPINQLPFYSSSLLSTKHISPSNQLDPLLDRLYVPLSLHPPSNPPISSSAPINRMYHISGNDITRLQEIAGGNHSKTVSFTAYLWQILAKSTFHGEKSCSMGIVVNGRSRMKNSYSTKFMKNYFGNVLSILFGNLHTETLLDMKLAAVADEVHNWLSPGLTEDHFLGLLDWVEAHRPEPSAASIYMEDSNEEEKSLSCVVSSGRGFPEINFGWGKAVFGTYHFNWGGNCGYVMPIPQPNTGDWVVYAHVAPSVIAIMEEEPTIFHKLKADYFLGSDNHCN